MNDVYDRLKLFFPNIKFIMENNRISILDKSDIDLFRKLFPKKFKDTPKGFYNCWNNYFSVICNENIIVKLYGCENIIYFEHN